MNEKSKIKKRNDTDEIRTRASYDSRFRVYRLNHSATVSAIYTHIYTHMVETLYIKDVLPCCGFRYAIFFYFSPYIKWVRMEEGIYTSTIVL